MPPAEPGTTMSANGIDLINENETGRSLPCLLKEVSNTRGSDTYKHFDKVTATDRKKWNISFSSNRFSNQSFSCTRGSHQKDTFWNSSTEFLKFFRIF